MWLCPRCGAWNTGYVTTTGCACCGYNGKIVTYGTDTSSSGCETKDDL